MLHRILRLDLLVLMPLALAAFSAHAQECCAVHEGSPRHVIPDSTGTSPREVQKKWAWGLGRANVLDTYLSPLEYTGPDFMLYHTTRRATHWGGGRWKAVADYTVHFAYLDSPTDDGRELDTEISAAGGLVHEWHPAPQWRLSAGGLVEGSGGGTYNTRNANNPAQGRLGLQLEATAQAEWSFRLCRKPGCFSLRADVPLTGVQFSPQYGQSYYEIFSLGHTGGIIHFTHPGNVPSVRLQAQAVLPLWGAHLSLGYMGDVRQSKLGGLRRHAWRNGFFIGFRRTLHLLR